MNDILKGDPWKNYKKNFKYIDKRFNLIFNHIKDDIHSDMNILDIGQQNPFTLFMQKKLKTDIDNTKGDLDTSFSIPQKKYDIVIYSHTIEHQFNPLYTILKLKKYMKHDALIFIIVPQRPKFLWTKHHYHEIDDHRMNLLIKRAGYKILGKKNIKVRRGLKFHLSGIRPFLRLFINNQMIYKIKNV